MNCVHTRLKQYTPGTTIRTRRVLLQGVEYYLQVQGPLRAKELYPLMEDEIMIKGMTAKSLALLIGKSGLFIVAERDRHEGILWRLPG